MKVMPIATAFRKAQLMIREFERITNRTASQESRLDQWRDLAADLRAEEIYPDTITRAQKLGLLPDGYTIE